MAKDKQDERTMDLFDMGPPKPVDPAVRRPRRPIWTEHKAKLIERYLFFFEMVTHHGTYIDGFAGPQRDDKHDMWSAKLVLEMKPRWFRYFYLFDVDPAQVMHLERLRDAQPPMEKPLKRDVFVTRGDFNEEIKKLLATRSIKDKATFCLLDQRTFECKWETIKELAQYKPVGEHKIELFYFLGTGWLDRSLAALTVNKQKGADWWGREDWESLQGMNGVDRANLLADRFKNELGYVSAKAWPIMGRENCQGAVMYYMIHATDHPAAPGLMARAYTKVVAPPETFEQLSMDELLKPLPAEEMEPPTEAELAAEAEAAPAAAAEAEPEPAAYLPGDGAAEMVGGPGGRRREP